MPRIVLPLVALALLAACEPLPLRDLSGRPDLADAGDDDADSPDAADAGPDAPSDEGTPTCDLGSKTATAGEYPTTELVLKIIQPTAAGRLSVAGSRIALAGIAFGKVDRVTWAAAPSGATGTATMSLASPYWQTDGVDLVPGDNTLTVTAEGPDGQESDTLVLTYNPEFLFPEPLEVRPPALFTGDARNVVAVIGLGSGLDPNRVVTLHQVNPDGTDGPTLATMVDDGKVTESGDEIQGDGLYTAQAKLTCAQTGRILLRAHVRGTDPLDPTGTTFFDATSPAGELDCVPRLNVTSCQAHQHRLSLARKAWMDAAAQGECAARAAAAAVLAADPDRLESAGDQEPGAPWIRWKDGTLGAVNVGTDAMRGAGLEGVPATGWGQGVPGDLHDDPTAEAAGLHDHPLADAADLPALPVFRSVTAIQSRKALLMGPFHGTGAVDDEPAHAAQVATPNACPPWKVDGPRYGSASDLAAFRTMSQAGVVVLATHGDIAFQRLSPAARAAYGWRHQGAQEILWTGEPVDCGRLAQDTTVCSDGSECPTGSRCLPTSATYVKDKPVVKGVCYDDRQVDLMSGRAVLGDRTWGVTPEFVSWYGRRQPYPASLVILGACRSLWNGTLAAAFYGAGARAILGWSGPVSDDFAASRTAKVLDRFFKQKLMAANAWNLGGQDPANPGTFLRFFGQRNLAPPDSGLLNGNFQTGDLTGWDVKGDGRVIRHLGETQPASGKYMGILSTGLGYTVNKGQVEQRFCIPPGTARLSFYWDFFSEEFKEYCGSVFNDRFLVRLVDPDGKEVPVLERSITLLCQNGEMACGATGSCDKVTGCTKCGQTEDDPPLATYVGLEKADVSFDQNDVWRTGWQVMTFDVGAYAGKGPVTLRFYSDDTGDSIFDTAVLVNRVELQ